MVLATDVDGACVGFGTASARRVVAAHPDAFAEHDHEFAPGSMGPKVGAAVAFARMTGRPAVIGALEALGELVAGTAGTRVAIDVDGLLLAPST